MYLAPWTLAARENVSRPSGFLCPHRGARDTSRKRRARFKAQDEPQDGPTEPQGSRTAHHRSHLLLFQVNLALFLLKTNKDAL